MPTVKVHFLPDLVRADETAGAMVVVIDVLRATTTIVYALAAGATKVVPCLEVDEARKIAGMFAPGDVLLGGERGGVRIDGFDLGNSPSEYTPEAVRGRTLLFTTTNGTKAMTACRRARRIVVGSFVNLSAVAAVVAGEEEAHLVCAGTHGRITREDVLFSGAVVDWLECRKSDLAIELNDQARLARDAWRAAVGSLSGDTQMPCVTSRLVDALAESQGGRNLARVGLLADLVDVARIDQFPIVAELDPERWSIRAA